MSDTKKTVKIAARIPKDLHKRLQHEATERDIPLNAMICLVLSQSKHLSPGKALSR